MWELLICYGVKDLYRGLNVPWYLIVNDRPIAYVDERKTVIDPKTAALIEPCLMAYGMRVNMGVEEDIIKYGRKLTGYPLKFNRTDIGEGYIVHVIEVCIGASTGLRVKKEPIEKIYELSATSTEKEEVEQVEGEEEALVEFEQA